ncbi:MAG TPA: Ig-like domain-containing protein [Candidatus Eisenbacteria bacterium]|nr:Ig-like domain-containing protein [Candidatus Eisenbacteria bacterium]
MKLFKLLAGIACLVVLFIFRPEVAFAGNPPDAGFSSLSANQVPADGNTQATVTITLHDSGNVALTGDTVSISAPGDGSAVILPTSTTLDGSGQATFTITSTTVGTDAITVTDTTTSTTLVALGNVVFGAVPTSANPQNLSDGAGGSAGCKDSAPTEAPNLYQIVVAKTSVTLFFAPPNTSFDGFIISYGTTFAANTYTTRFSQSATGGAVRYTINDLNPKTMYYFKVQATSGCAVGPASGVLSTQNTTNSSKLLEAGPGNILFIGGMGGLFSILIGIALFAFL